MSTIPQLPFTPSRKRNVKTKSTEKDQNVLHFVQFKGYLFPIGKSDVEKLQDCRIPSTQFQQEALPLLQHTLNKSLTIEVMPWVELYAKLKSHLIDSIPSSIQVKHENNWILFGQTKEGNVPVDDAVLTSRVKQLQNILGRYCVLVKVQVKDKPNLRLTRLELTFDNSIPNHQHYGDVAIEETPMVDLDLSRLCRFSLGIKKVPSIRYIRGTDAEGNPCSKAQQSLVDHLHLEVKDSTGTGYQTAVQRSFPVSSLKTEDVMNMVKFLLTLTKNKKG